MDDVNKPVRREASIEIARSSSFLGGSVSKESACNVGDLGSIPELGRSPGGGKGYLLQYSSLENPMDRGAWWATVHGVAKTWTRLSDQAQKEAKGTWTWGKKRGEGIGKGLFMRKTSFGFRERFEGSV